MSRIVLSRRLSHQGMLLQNNNIFFSLGTMEGGSTRDFRACSSEADDCLSCSSGAMNMDESDAGFLAVLDAVITMEPSMMPALISY